MEYAGNSVCHLYDEEGGFPRSPRACAEYTGIAFAFNWSPGMGEFKKVWRRTMQKFWVIFIWTKSICWLAKIPEESGLEQGVSTSKFGPMSAKLFFVQLARAWLFTYKAVVIHEHAFKCPIRRGFVLCGKLVIDKNIDPFINKLFHDTWKLLEIYPILEDRVKIDWFFNTTLKTRMWIHNHSGVFRKVLISPWTQKPWPMKKLLKIIGYLVLLVIVVIEDLPLLFLSEEFLLTM